MTEFFFGSWPTGAGPLIVQFVLVTAGAAAGIRVVDDVKSWVTSRGPASSD